MELDWLKTRAQLSSEKVAIISPDDNEEWTYADLHSRAVKISIYLKEIGIEKNDRVAYHGINDIAYFDFLFACHILGAVFVPLNWKLKSGVLRYIQEDSQYKFIAFTDKEQDKNTRQLKSVNHINVNSQQYQKIINSKQTKPYLKIDKDWEDIAVILYTSGTTGQPKGAKISYRQLINNALFSITSWNLTQNNSTLVSSPLFHTGALSCLTYPLLVNGGQIVLQKRFDAQQSIEYIKSYQITHIYMVAAMYYNIVHADNFHLDALESVKVFISGGGPISSFVYDQFDKYNLPLINSYGLTEVGSNNFYISPKLAKKKRESIGKPIMFIDVLIVDENNQPVPQGASGELLIKGLHTFSGYLNLKKETADIFYEGYVRTGDLATVDADGDYFLVGRKKDLIITGGENVYPSEVETVIGQHPLVEDVKVVGVPDPKWGERLVAGVVLNKQAENVDNIETVLRDFGKKHLANFKVPKNFVVFDEFPITEIGKLDINVITERISKEF